MPSLSHCTGNPVAALHGKRVCAARDLPAIEPDMRGYAVIVGEFWQSADFCQNEVPRVLSRSVQRFARSGSRPWFDRLRGGTRDPGAIQNRGLLRVTALAAPVRQSLQFRQFSGARALTPSEL